MGHGLKAQTVWFDLELAAGLLEFVHEVMVPTVIKQLSVGMIPHDIACCDGEGQLVTVADLLKLQLILLVLLV